MDAQGLLSELSLVLGITLYFNEDNACRIIFSEDAVDFEIVQNGSEQSIFIIANLANFVDNKIVFERLLRANYLSAQTRGATIGLNEEGFMMHRQLLMPMEYPDFERALEHFVLSLRYWKEWIALPHDTDEEDSEEDAAFMANPMAGMIRI